MQRIYVVRHGQSEVNVTREFSYKKVDRPLTALGREQAERTAAWFGGRAVEAVFASPLLRARETAEAIARTVARPVRIIEEFREVNTGDFEGQPPTDELWAEYESILDAWMDGDHGRTIPGGEDFHTLVARVHAGFAQVLGEGHAEAVVVAHGGTLMAAVAALVPGASIREHWAKGIPNCGITEFRFPPGAAAAELVRFSEASHLA